jgi:hypothetical protein
MHLIAEIHQPYLKKEGYPHRHLFLSMPVATSQSLFCSSRTLIKHAHVKRKRK